MPVFLLIDVNYFIIRNKKGYGFLRIAVNLPKHIFLKLFDKYQCNSVMKVGQLQREVALFFP